MKNELKNSQRVYSIVKDGIDRYNLYGLLPDAPWDEFSPEIKPVAQYLEKNQPTKEELARYIAKVFEDFFSLERKRDFWLELLSTANFILNRLEKKSWIEETFSYVAVDIKGICLFSYENSLLILEECRRRKEEVIQIESFFLRNGKWEATSDSLNAGSGKSKEEMWEKCEFYLNKMKDQKCYFRIGI